MSAIAGIYRGCREPIPSEDIHRIMGALGKYPADRTDVWHKDHIMLGNHAQWVTVQSHHEQLPFYDARRGLAITADAIIDNRDELMELLQVPPGKRAHLTDSEIILLAYEAWAERTPERLVGDFAFVIWDEQQQLLFGARDFSGARTLYYYHDAEQMAFSTMISPLLSLPYIHRKLNECWLAEFLAISGVFEPPDLSRTIYGSIYQLPPSHTFKVQDRKLSIQRYNSLSDIQPLKLGSTEEYVEAFREVFHTAVTSRLRRTRLNVGAHLSGGLDSGSVVSLAARALQKENRTLHTYSYVPADGFVDWTPKRRLADESPLIRQTVQYVGNINDQYLSFHDKNPFTEIDDWLDTLEHPYKFFDNTFWLRGIYEQAQLEKVGILLNGARGNYSISWGPALDYYARLFKKLRWLRLSRELGQYGRNADIGRRRLISVLVRKAIPALDRWKPAASHPAIPQLINPDFARRAGIEEKLQDPAFTGIGSMADLSPDPLEARQQHFNRVNVWSTTGTTNCKLSLRYSVWSHDPTNDLRVIRFCLGTPIEQFVSNGMDRALIRRSTEGLLPDSIRLNQRTRGIQAADAVQRMNKDWPQFLNELDHISKDSRMQQFINMPVFQSALDEARHGLEPNQAYSPTIKLLMRSTILHRFLKKNF
ncbi:asparagine synthase-related protein [Paenibacillus sp. FSL M8-0334]|uniref:asparagine synthase-related protein n=1 Tax=Paenibacillus sp. FSL M8-0334 TaxID=2921623 RepID=UPI0030F9552E